MFCRLSCSVFLSSALLLAIPAGQSFAQTFGANLVQNGNAETGDITGFTSPVGTFSVAQYNQGSFPGGTDPGVSAGGRYLFYGGQSDASTGEQLISVYGLASAIDVGNVSFDLSAYLGGFQGQGDNAVLSVAFRDNTNTVLGIASIGPVTSADRGGSTGLLFRDTSGLVPVGTVILDLTLVQTRTDGTDNDGYADNLSLVLTQGDPVAVPGPVAGAGLPAFAALARAWFVRRRRRRLAA